jgi:hypothetical protein
MANGKIVEAIILAIGLAVGGALVGSGFARAKSADRYVTVKVSPSARSAPTWRSGAYVVAADNEANIAHARLEGIAGVRQFLAGQGLDTTSRAHRISVSDAQANSTRASVAEVATSSSRPSCSALPTSTRFSPPANAWAISRASA